MVFRRFLLCVLLGSLVLMGACSKSENKSEAETSISETESDSSSSAAVSKETGEEEYVAEDEAEELPRDTGTVCDFHMYSLQPGTSAVMPFTFPIGAEDPGYLSFSIEDKQGTEDGLEFSVENVEIESLTHPVWQVDISSYASPIVPFVQANLKRGTPQYVIAFNRDGIGTILINSLGLIKTGLLSEAELIKQLIDNTVQVNLAKTGGPGAGTVEVPLEKSDRETYFATVYVAVTVPENEDYEGTGGGTIIFKGDPAGEFKLLIHRMSTISAFQIHGPDDRASCYDTEN